MTDTMVRMGELAASRTEGAWLVSLGLGSCIGLTLLDRRVGVAGLAHIVLPASTGHTELNRFKFADHAVPELIARVVALGGRRQLLEAVLVGGASMFGGAGTTLEVGARNDAAVRAALSAARIRVVAAETGGSCGRTVRVAPSSGLVTVRRAGGIVVQLHPSPSLSPRSISLNSANRSLQEVV
jgi:chemotaxis protein CheD